jgi:3',5'-cyclic AMP phosphodiesterase CpdA
MAKLIQLSDLHLVSPGKLTSKVLDTNAILEETINEILSKKDYFGQIDGLVVTGDISDDGSMESYLSAYEKLSKLNVPILVIPGNHDLRDPMRKVFHENVQFSKNSSQFDWVFEFDETLIIGLDTLVEGENFGFLEEKSLDFLSHQLSNNSGSDLVLLIHHPPIKTGIYFMDQIGLTNSSDLSECLKATNRPIKILCGHVHGVYHGLLGIHPVVSAPSICSAFEFNRQEFAPVGFNKGPTGYAYLETSSNGFWTSIPSNYGNGPLKFSDGSKINTEPDT